MSLPHLIKLEDYPVNEYLDIVYSVFKDKVVNGNLSFLELPVLCPWHPPYDNKHFSFWHLISTKGVTRKEEDRIPDIRRCERIEWIAYVIQNANNKNKVWCWEKDIKTSRGRNKHIHLYLHEQHYLVVLRRKKTRLELVTTFVVTNHKRKQEEISLYDDPRKY